MSRNDRLFGSSFLVEFFWWNVYHWLIFLPNDSYYRSVQRTVSLRPTPGSSRYVHVLPFGRFLCMKRHTLVTHIWKIHICFKLWHFIPINLIYLTVTHPTWSLVVLGRRFGDLHFTPFVSITGFWGADSEAEALGGIPDAWSMVRAHGRLKFQTASFPSNVTHVTGQKKIERLKFGLVTPKMRVLDFRDQGISKRNSPSFRWKNVMQFA